MPIQRCGRSGKGWRYGKSGKCYASKADAVKQMQAILVSGYREPTGNVRAKNPLRGDPSRTATLRRLFEAELRRRFARVAKQVQDLLLVEDAFGLVRESTLNYNPSQPRDSEGKWSSGGGGAGGVFTADKLPSDMTGDVEFLDDNDDIVATMSVEEARLALKEHEEMGLDIKDVRLRQSSEATKAEAEQKREEYWKQREQQTAELRRIESLATPSGLRPGHPGYVEPPDHLYHATFAADKIKAEGLKSSDELGQQTLGGSASNLISFTTKDNAEKYRDGLNIARKAARGELTKDELVSAGTSHGVSESRMNDLMLQHGDNDFAVLQAVSLEGKQFPLFMGTGWPDHLKDAEPASTIFIRTADVKDLYYNPGETEWRVGDYKGVTANARWVFRTKAEQIAAFLKWLQGVLKAEVLAGKDDGLGEAYWRKFVEEAYQKGQGRAFDDVRVPAVQKDMRWYNGTKEEFLRSSFGRPMSVEKVQLMAGRVFTDLKGVTEAVATVIGRELTEGFARGDNPHVLARRLKDELGFGSNRAATIARSEVIRAHAEGQLDALERLGVTEVGVMVEWDTAGDGRVCRLCQAMQGVVLTIKEARGMIPRHPNCRCAHLPANVGEPKKEQVRRKEEIQAAITKSLKAEKPKKRTLAEQRKRTKWVGPDKRIAKKRPISVVS